MVYNQRKYGSILNRRYHKLGRYLESKVDCICKRLNFCKQAKNTPKFSFQKFQSSFQTNENSVVCNAFIALSKLETSHLNVILFVSLFDQAQVNGVPGCSTAIDVTFHPIAEIFFKIQTLKSKLDSIICVRMNVLDKIKDLTNYFPDVEILHWKSPFDIGPYGWLGEFWATYSCGKFFGL